MPAATGMRLSIVSRCGGPSQPVASRKSCSARRGEVRALDARADDLVASPAAGSSVTSSASDNACTTDTSGCRPSSRGAPTNRQRLTLPGARAYSGHRHRLVQRAPLAPAPSVSARASGGRPIASSAARARSRSIPASASEPGSALRRCAKPALTRARAAPGRAAGRCGAGRRARSRRSAPGGRRSATRAAGRAPRTRAGRAPTARRRRSCPASRPAARPPRAAPSPPASRRSAAPRPRAGSPSPRRRRAGSRRPWSAPGRARRGRAGRRRRSAASCSGAGPGRRAARARACGPPRPRARARHAAARYSDSTPSPPPTSSTTSSGSSSASRPITPSRFESIRKFCPRSRLGRIPNAFMRRRLGCAGSPLTSRTGARRSPRPPAPAPRRRCRGARR